MKKVVQYELPFNSQRSLCYQYLKRKLRHSGCSECLKLRGFFLGNVLNLVAIYIIDGGLDTITREDKSTILKTAQTRIRNAMANRYILGFTKR